MRTVLVISPHFPPSTLAGVHRARHLAKWLPSHGWTPIIIRVDESFYAEPGDDALSRLVPATVIQENAAALPTRLMRPFGVGDVGIRGFKGLQKAIGRAVASHNPKAALITGSPFYPMLLAFRLKRFGLPVILDFQDPWVSNEGARRPYWSKGRMAHRLSVFLEPKALRHSDFVTSVSQRQNEEMVGRYPWLNASRMAAIPIGGDPSDFVAAKAAEIAQPKHALDPSKINLSYVGTLLPRAGPVAMTLLRGIKRATDNAPGLSDKLVVNFVGTSNQPGASGQGPVTPLAKEAGVAHLVRETARRVPYLEALSILARSNGLLMFGSDEPHYTASKIYPGLMSGTPFLSLFHEASSAHSILRDAGGGASFSFSELRDLSELENSISQALLRLMSQPKSFGMANAEAYAPYTADAVAGDFARVLNSLVDHR